MLVGAYNVVVVTVHMWRCRMVTKAASLVEANVICNFRLPVVFSYCGIHEWERNQRNCYHSNNCV